jgi:hypothetical protein
MPTVTTRYRVYLGAGHHRRPRNQRPWEEQQQPSTSTQLEGTIYTPFAPASLPYTTADGSTVNPRFLFWGISHGATGRTEVQQALMETIRSTPLTLTAWYFLAAGGDGASALLLDAYSVLRGDFVDDDFVDVVSDPSLTEQANVAGSVPTAEDQELKAFGSIPTSESFERWILTPSKATASGAILDAPAGSDGLAIATYHLPEPVPGASIEIGRPLIEPAGGIVLRGKAGGPVVLVTPGGIIGPIDPPIGILIARLVAASAMHAEAAHLSKEAASSIQKSAALEIAEVAKEIANTIEDPPVI